MADTLNDRVTRMLIQSRAAHERARTARTNKQLEAHRVELTTARDLRTQAHLLDPDHASPAWALETKPTHGEFMAFYEKQLGK